ncbi:hypothetical protein KKD81_02570 [Patescibacteria group bacterium]|nr:hypothetical protein [Patescibacteria group bacterium]MBU2158586.1 hypothetical protein [Patescibacteria group bacterium]MBU2220797.1 hypothetical protein [Patescibacteria group bacterium]
MDISIESLLARRQKDTSTLAKQLVAFPVFGSRIRSHLLSKEAKGPREQWATLPPLVLR